MPQPRKPFSEWTTEDIKRLAEEPPAEESASLDFKRECHLLHDDPGARDKARKDILKDIAAMANGVGGLLAIGIDESREADKPPIAGRIPGVPADDARRLQDSIVGVVDTYLHTRPAPLRFKIVPVPGKSDRAVLMVGVSQNTYSLSMVTYTQFNQFWVRRGWNNKLMTIDEIQYRFERAATVRESAERELENVRKELSAYFTTEPMAWVAAVPLSRQVDHIPVDIAAMKQIVESSSYFAAFPKRADMKYLHPKAFLSVLRPTLRGIGSHPDWKNIGLLELRRDGTVVFAAGGERVQEVARYRRPLWMIYEPWYSGLYLLQDVQKSYSVSPMAIAQCGLLNWEESSLQPIGNRPDGWTRADLKVGDLNVPMYPKLLDEDWCPAEAFMDWAKQLANYLHQDKAISVRPWVTQ